MIINVPLVAGTALTNVRYEWLANGAIGPTLSTGITQPDPTYPNFRFDVTPPTGAEELIVWDSTDETRWNVAEYLSLIAGAPAVPLSTTLSNLRLIAAAYLRVTPDAFIVNGVDLFLASANSARVQAELAHDFEYSRIVATVDMTAAGVDLRDATIIQGDATAGVKSVVGVRRFGTNGFFYGLDFTRLDIAIERDRSELELCDEYAYRYPGDPGSQTSLLYYGTNTGIVQQGQRLSVYPGFSSLDPAVVQLFIDGYGWLPDYGTFDSGGQPEDFIVKYGTDYLQWAIICDLNIMLAALVPRQEGNSPSPTAERDDAWKKLVLWDSYLVDGALTRSA